MKYVYALIVLLLALFLAAFIQQNGMGIQLKYFSWSTPELPLSLYMILSFAAGYALAVLVGFTSTIRFSFRASGAEKEVRQLRSELEQVKKEEVVTTGSKSQVETRDVSGDPSSAVDESIRSGDEPTKNLSGECLEPDSNAAITGSGGEEEK
jgi:uncharacterized integral membrane protein